ncbi:MAG: hypothetical protein IPL28_25270 [Chloroflexi bacterium]|nr:hypothetical protein [Chloroflexota bacterium]
MIGYAMAKNPEDRYATAGELARAFAQAIGHTSTTFPTAMPRPCARPTPSHLSRYDCHRFHPHAHPICPRTCAPLLAGVADWSGGGHHVPVRLWGAHCGMGQWG